MTTVSKSRGLVALVLVAGFAPAPAHAYRTLAELEGSATPIVWVEAPTIALDPSGLDEEQARWVTEELQAAIATWNGVDCAGELAAFVGTEPAVALVVVRMVPNWTESGFDPTAAGTTDVVLATTMGGGTAIVGATLSLNGSFTWGPHPTDTEGSRDLRAVITHELGHVLGLEHSDDASSTMYAVYTGSAQANLAADDVAGICSLYSIDAPPPPPSCAHDEECLPGHWCIEGACRPELRYGSECTDGSDCFGARCVAVEGGGVCSYPCEARSDCPSATSCLQVEGRDERVCAPTPAGSGCTVAAGGTPMPLLVLLSSLLALLGLRRARHETHPTLIRRRRVMPLAMVLLASCGTSHPADDAGSEPDSGSQDSGHDQDAGSSEDASIVPDAGPTPVCDPGQLDVAPCGFCGMQGRTCDAAGQWMATSECLGEGECAVGSVETRDLEMCAQEQRLCLAGCAWGSWEETRGPGVCVPGEIRVSSEACTTPGDVRDERCDDTCSWVGTSTCMNPCATSPRTTPEWEREVCVPAGNFMRGSTTYTNTQPVAEVYVSAYLIDAYPVTNRRYMQCVSAGACTASSHAGYSLPERIDFPVEGITRPQAMAFCAWDGRRLPTEAEWEKAVRGPSPRTNPYPWPGTTWDCSLVANARCGWSEPTGLDWAADPYNGLPGTRSFYDTYLQISGTREWVLDYYSSTFYSDPDSLVDPLATEADAEGVPPWGTRRGFVRELEGELTARASGNPVSATAGFRCARSAP